MKIGVQILHSKKLEEYFIRYGIFYDYLMKQFCYHASRNLSCMWLNKNVKKIPFKCLRKIQRLKPRSGGAKFPMLNRKHKYSAQVSKSIIIIILITYNNIRLLKFLIHFFIWIILSLMGNLK